MAVDLNMDMGQIIKSLISKKGSGGVSFQGMGGNFSLEAYKFALIILALLIIVSGAYITAVYMPMQEANGKKTEELNKIIEMKKQLGVLDAQIVSLKNKLDKSKEEYIQSLAHFGNSEDLGALYQTVSTLASKYGLVVLNLKEIAPPPVVKKKEVPAPAPANNKKNNKDDLKKETAEPKKPAVEVKEVKVEVELKGNYSEYIHFKEDLAVAEILLKVNSESIMVKDDKEEQGSIYVNLNLSTYAIDKKPFQGVISENEQEIKTEVEDEKAN